MKTTFLALVILLLSMASCHSPTAPGSTAAVASVDTLAMLDYGSVFRHEPVDKYKASPEAVRQAHAIYIEALTLLEKKKDAHASVPLFFKSLRLSPEPNTYLKYADAMFASQDYIEAKNAYDFAAGFDQPISAFAHLGVAKSEAMQGDSFNAIHDLDMAMEAYPFDSKKILDDPAFAKIRETELFKTTMVRHIMDSRTRKKALMGMFEKNFTKASLPYAIGFDSLPSTSGQYMDYDFVDFIPELVRSMGMEDGDYLDFHYVASYDLSPLFHTFLYRTVGHKTDFTPVHHILMTMDQNDTIISTQEIACACSPLTVRTAAIDADGVIEVKEYAQTWDQDPTYHTDANNKITGRELKHTTHYQITGDGHIVEKK